MSSRLFAIMPSLRSPGSRFRRWEHELFYVLCIIMFSFSLVRLWQGIPKKTRAEPGDTGSGPSGLQTAHRPQETVCSGRRRTTCRGPSTSPATTTTWSLPGFPAPAIVRVSPTAGGGTAQEPAIVVPTASVPATSRQCSVGHVPAALARQDNLLAVLRRRDGDHDPRVTPAEGTNGDDAMTSPRITPTATGIYLACSRPGGTLPAFTGRTDLSACGPGVSRAGGPITVLTRAPWMAGGRRSSFSFPLTGDCIGMPASSSPQAGRYEMP